MNTNNNAENSKITKIPTSKDSSFIKCKIQAQNTTNDRIRHSLKEQCSTEISSTH